jgi:hypothetical protein
MEVGSAVLALSLGWSIGSLLLGQIVDRIGTRNASIAGAVFLTAGCGLTLSFSTATSFSTCFWVFLFVGTGMGFVALGTILVVQNSLSDLDLGVATASNQFSVGLAACCSLPDAAEPGKPVPARGAGTALQRHAPKAPRRRGPQRAVGLLDGPRCLDPVSSSLLYSAPGRKRRRSLMRLHTKLDTRTFLLPYMFITAPQMLLIGFPFIDEIQRKEDAGRFLKGLYDLNLPY